MKLKSNATIHPVEYSYGELLKRALRLSRGGETFSLQSILEELSSAISAISIKDTIADVPDPLILSMIASQVIEFDPKELSIESHNGVMIFLGMLLAAYLNTNNIEIHADVSDITSDDLEVIKGQLDQIYEEKMLEGTRNLEETNQILSMTIYAFHDRLKRDLENRANITITETEPC